MNRHIAGLLEPKGHVIRDVRPVGGGDICDAWWVATDQGDYFAKSPRRRAPGMLPLEAQGLVWLNEGGIPTPGVVAVDESCLILDWLEAESPNAESAQQLGRDLAILHDHPADGFGCGPGTPTTDSEQGYVGSLPVPFGQWGTWPEFYVEARIRPTMQAAGVALSEVDRTTINRLCEQLMADPEHLAGPEVQPSRVHGDLWSGNIMWLGEGAAAVDPAAHGGHPESDLAMLHLFGAPFLTQILQGYQDARTLPADWQARIALHQLFPVLVHAALFGGGYGSQAGRLAARSLKAHEGG